MNRTDETVHRNKKHYDDLYSRSDLLLLIERIQNHDRFLSEATATDAGWVSFYLGGFRDRLDGARILDLGCGEGLNSLIMAKHGADVVAVDISEETPRIVRHLAEATGLSERVEARAGDFRVMEFQEKSFDFVVGQAFLHHLNHELEDQVIRRASSLLKGDGEVRFVEPAINSKILDGLRWLMPVPGRPSILQRKAFTRWSEADAHPRRDNSSRHFEALGLRYFREVEVVPMGGIDRLYRLLPRTSAARRFRRWAFRFERNLPKSINKQIARIQTVIYRRPRRGPNDRPR